MTKKTRININTNIKVYIKVFLSFLFNNGDKNENTFIKYLRDFLNEENLLLTSQGRVAAYNIFKVVISENKKEIIISPYTLTEVISAILYANAKPVYVDIDLKTGLPLEDELDKKINAKTAALVVTHLYSNKKDIIRFKEKYKNKIKIIEDVAINFGAKLDQQKFLGTVFDYGFYSFGVMKNLCTFHGGALFSKDKSKFNEIKTNLNKNYNYPLFSSIKLLIFCLLIDFFYSKFVYKFFTHFILRLSIQRIDELMYPGVYPKLSSKIPNHYRFKYQKNFSIAGIENLKNLEIKIENRIKNIKLYEKYLNNSLRINNYDYYNVNSFLEYPILLKKNTNRYISQKLLNNGYDIRHTWYVNSARFIQQDDSFKNFKNCEYLHEHVLSLPTHHNINESDIINISEMVNAYEK